MSAHACMHMSMPAVGVSTTRMGVSHRAPICIMLRWRFPVLHVPVSNPPRHPETGAGDAPGRGQLHVHVCHMLAIRLTNSCLPHTCLILASCLPHACLMLASCVRFACGDRSMWGRSRARRRTRGDGTRGPLVTRHSYSRLAGLGSRAADARSM